MTNENPLPSNTTSPHPKHQLPSYTSNSSIPSLPLALKATYTSSWSKLLCSNSASKPILLSPSPSKPQSQPHSNNAANQPEPSFKVSLPNSFRGSIILNHASESTAPLARASPEGRRGYAVILPGSSVAESLRRRSRENQWWFALALGIDGEVETFEWRRSRGSEIKQLGASGRGWKLVRLGSGSRGQHDASRDQYREGDDESLARYSGEDEKHGGADSARVSEESGGDDVVAVWARTGTWTSLHDIGEFAFLGSGASGQLGQRFAVMAVMTALCIWQKAMRDQATAGTVVVVT